MEISSQDSINLIQRVNKHIIYMGEYRLIMKPPQSQDKQKQLTQQFKELIIIESLQNLKQVQQTIDNFLPKNQINKMVLYTLQISNLRILISKQENTIASSQLQSITQFIQILYKISQKHKFFEKSTKKSLLILLYNLLKNKIIPIQNFQQQLNPIIPKVIDMCLQSHHQKNQQQPTQHTQLQELQWLIYLLEYCNQQYKHGFLKNTYKQISQLSANKNNNNRQQQFLKFISLIISKVIDDRSTTEIIKGYSSHLTHIREMYCKKSKLYFRIHFCDYQFVMGLFQHKVQEYKKVIKIGDSQLAESVSCCLLNCLTIFHCALYFGGYSPGIQKITNNVIMKDLFQLLEISYLLYELCATRIKKVKLVHVYTNNLKKLLGGTQQEQKQQQQQIKVNKQMIAEGQLTSVIRLSSNMIHINKQDQAYLQNNLHYLRIILSLTHEDQKQLTMKQWAIIFIKNVCDISAIMREQIQKMKLNIKVDPNNMASPI